MTHHIASNALKALLGVKKINFSKSPRKGEVFHYALKTPNIDGAADKIQKSLLEENPAFVGWELFMSKDGSTTGLYRIDY